MRRSKRSVNLSSHTEIPIFDAYFRVERVRSFRREIRGGTKNWVTEMENRTPIPITGNNIP